MRCVVLGHRLPSNGQCGASLAIEACWPALASGVSLVLSSSVLTVSNFGCLLLQIAMMGGNVEHLLEQEGKVGRGPATKPMPVSDFLDKGLGGAQLPRQQQDRKDKEKKKRAAGQSTHSVWKSEAEMVLRQQFD